MYPSFFSEGEDQMLNTLIKAVALTQAILDLVIYFR